MTYDMPGVPSVSHEVLLQLCCQKPSTFILLSDFLRLSAEQHAPLLVNNAWIGVGMYSLVVRTERLPGCAAMSAVSDSSQTLDTDIKALVFMCGYPILACIGPLQSCRPSKHHSADADQDISPLQP